MENMGEWEQSSLINELTQGREHARQLQVHLNVPISDSANSSSSHETREFLVQKIQASYEKALSMLNFNTSSLAADQPQPSSVVAVRMSESPPSRSGSPRSDQDSDRDFKELDQFKDIASKKRKTLPRWTQQVQVTPGTALEGPLDDGFSWRKYGQKDILGAKYPRGYYRCTHRNVQGCLATKQVQRSDDDPTIFEITYRGRHTCTTSLAASHAMQIPADHPSQYQQQACTSWESHQSQDLLLNFQRGLKVITQDLDDVVHPHHQTYPSASSSSSSFPHHPSSTIKVENNNIVFSPSVINNNVVGNPSPSFISPATSGTSYFSMSQTPSGAINNSTVHRNTEFPATSDGTRLITDIIQSAATSATNSPTVGLGFPLGGNAEFDPNFTFDNHGFFS